MGFPHPTFQFNEYFTPYLKYQIAENAKPCKKSKTKYLLNIFKEKLLVSNTCCVFRKLPRFIQLVYIKVFSY